MTAESQVRTLLGHITAKSHAYLEQKDKQSEEPPHKERGSSDAGYQHHISV
jgi:hypothetical protein